MHLPLIKTNALEEYLCDFDHDGFTYEWQNNQQRQISFTITRTANNADLFDLLQIGISVILDGQEYMINQATPQSSGQVITKEIVATHILFECQKAVYQYDTQGTNDHPVSLGPDDLMQWYFGGNTAGYTWEVQGTFNKQSMSGIGNGSGKDGLDLIVSKWDCYIWADNKHIIIADAEHFKTLTSKQLRYLYNTDDTKASIDRTSITNTTQCTGKAKTDASGNTTGYYFDPFIYANTASVAQWGTCYGAAVTDDRFTDKNSLSAYAETQLHPDPDVNVSTTYQGDEDVTEGEVWLFIAPLLGFDSDVTVLGLKKYPYSYKKPEVTLSNTLKDIYQIQREIAQSAQNAQKSAGQALSGSAAAKQAVDALNSVAVRIGDTTDTQQAVKIMSVRAASDIPILSIKKPDGTTFYPETSASAIPDLPSAPVQSVNGKTGDVMLTASDVGAVTQQDIDEAIQTINNKLAEKQDLVLNSPSGNKFTLAVADDGTLSTLPHTGG